MSRSRTQTALGLSGLIVTVAAGAAVVWGRVRSVEVPRRGAWGPIAPAVCVEGHRGEVRDAIAILHDHGHDLDLLPPPPGGACPERVGQIVVRVDPALDTAGPLGVGWVGGEIGDADEAGVRWGSTRVWQEGDRIVRALVRLHPDSAETAATHELLHALGWDHPVAPPTGHVMHPSAAGLRDWRGVKGP